MCGPYVVKHFYKNVTYSLLKLDVVELRTPNAIKVFKVFKKRQENDPRVIEKEAKKLDKDKGEDKGIQGLP